MPLVHLARNASRKIPILAPFRTLHSSLVHRTRGTPSARTRFAHASETESWHSLSGLVRPFLFASGVSAAAFALAAFKTERDNVDGTRRAAEQAAADSARSFSSRLFGHRPLQPDPQTVRHNEAPTGFFGRVASMLQMSLLELTPEMRVISGLVTLNAAVFFAWQVPQLQGFMMRHFLQFPSDGGRGITMLTAAFSHMSPMHLGMNMLGLVSFGGILGSVFASPDQRSSPGGARFREHSDPWAGAWELAAFFVAGCMASSFASQANSVRLFAKTAGKSVAPSLGASGGVYGIVTAVALVFPWTGVHVLFFPVSLRLGTVLPILLSLDFAGVVLKWQTFDHAAHLGGAAFGYMFMKWGGREAYLDLRKRIRARLSGGVTAKE